MCRKIPAHTRYQPHLGRTVLQHLLRQDLHRDHLKLRWGRVALLEHSQPPLLPESAGRCKHAAVRTGQIISDHRLHGALLGGSATPWQPAGKQTGRGGRGVCLMLAHPACKWMQQEGTPNARRGLPQRFCTSLVGHQQAPHTVNSLKCTLIFLRSSLSIYKNTIPKQHHRKITSNIRNTLTELCSTEAFFFSQPNSPRN